MALHPGDARNRVVLVRLHDALVPIKARVGLDGDVACKLIQRESVEGPNAHGDLLALAILEQSQEVRNADDRLPTNGAVVADVTEGEAVRRLAETPLAGGVLRPRTRRGDAVLSTLRVREEIRGTTRGDERRVDGSGKLTGFSIARRARKLPLDEELTHALSPITDEPELVRERKGNAVLVILPKEDPHVCARRHHEDGTQGCREGPPARDAANDAHLTGPERDGEHDTSASVAHVAAIVRKRVAVEERGLRLRPSVATQLVLELVERDARKGVQRASLRPLATRLGVATRLLAGSGLRVHGSAHAHAPLLFESSLHRPAWGEKSLCALRAPLVPRPWRYDTAITLSGDDLSTIGSQRAVEAIVAFADAVAVQAGILYWTDSVAYASALATGGITGRLTSEQERHVRDSHDRSNHWGRIIRGPAWGTFLNAAQVAILGDLLKLHPAKVVPLRSGGAYVQLTVIGEATSIDEPSPPLDRLQAALAPVLA